MKSKLFFLALFLIIPSLVYCTFRTKISGQILSAETDVAIAHARIEIIKTEEIILADEKGNFSIDIEQDNEPFEIHISSIGYKDKHFVFEAGVRYAVIPLESEPIIIPGITIKSTQDNVLTLAQSNISVMLPENANNLEIAELIVRHPDIIVKENAMGEQSIQLHGHESRHVTLMLDGLKLNNPSMNSFHAIPIEQIDHIEVITGNASSAAGDAAMGGVINFVTKKPIHDFSQDILITTGSWNNYSANLQTNLTTGKIKNLINIFGHKATNDFIYCNPLEEKDIRRTNNDITEGSISSKSTFELSKDLSSTLSFLLYKAEKGIPGQTTDYMWFSHARAHALKLDLKEQVRIQVNEYSHDVMLSFQQAESRYRNKIENPFYTYDSENRSRIFDALWQFDHIIGSCSSRAKVGFRHENYTYYDHLVPTQSIDLKIRNNVFASYESLIPFSLFKSSISIIPSLRIDKLMNDDAFLSSHLTIEVPRGPDKFQLSISGGNSYTMPEFTSLFWKGDSRVQGNPNLKPEQSLGGKTSVEWTSKYFSMKASASYNRIEDLIYWYRSAMGVWKPENLTDAELYGFSGTATWEPFEIVSLSLSGSKIVPINKTGSSDHHNKYLPHKPLHKFGTEVTVSPFPLECSFSLNTIGKQYDNFSNTVVVNGYTTCDVGISYSSKLSDNLRLNAFVGVKNIFDESYETSRNIPAPGRNFQCSLKLILQ